MGAGLFCMGEAARGCFVGELVEDYGGRGKGTDGRTPRSFAAGHSGNAVQDMVSVTLSKEKNNYERFCQSGVMLSTPLAVVRKIRIKKSLLQTSLQMKNAKCWTVGKTDN